MVRAIFKDLVIASAGSFPDGITIERAKSWTEMRKGLFVSDMDDSVTHLLCTDEEFKAKKRINRIKQAECSTRKVHIINWLWFEFSCTHNKKLREKDYDFSAMRAEKRERLRKQREREQRARNTMIGETWINPDLYHIATDKSHFRYEIKLYRASKDEYGSLQEKYELYLFESHAMPRLYWFGAKLFHKKDSGKWQARGIERTTATPGACKLQFDQFTKFFELKTSVRWSDRVIKAGTREKSFFTYSPPTRGKPVGGSMTGELYYKCIKSNKSWFRRWTDLFGDDLPVDIQMEDAAQETLEDIIDEACAFLEAEELLRHDSSGGLQQETKKNLTDGADKCAIRKATHEIIASDSNSENCEKESVPESGFATLRSPSNGRDVVFGDDAQGYDQQHETNHEHYSDPGSPAHGT